MAITIDVTVTVPGGGTGVSPVVVVFDASATTADGVTEPFIDLEYEWDFDDPTSGNWSDGDAKNSDFGPVAAHSYEIADETFEIFRPSLTVRNPTTGEEDSWTSTGIVIQGLLADGGWFEPSEVVCISTTADFTGAPDHPDVEKITTTDLNDINTQLGTGDRMFLLHAGQSWTFAGAIDLNTFHSNGYYFGRFGTGANPSITCGGQARLFDLANGAAIRVNINNIDATEAGTTTNFCEVTGTVGILPVGQVTLKGCSFTGGGRFFFCNPNLITTDKVYSRIAIVECTCQDQNGNVLWHSGEKLTLLGSHFFHTGGGGAHLIRTNMVDVGVYAHNTFDNPDLSRHHHKLHGGEFTTDGNNADSLDNRYSQYWVVRRNTYILGGECDWMFDASPQNNVADERIRYGIVEDNFFHLDQASSGKKIAITLHGEQLVARNNIILSEAGTTTHVAVVIGRDDGKAAGNPGSIDCRVIHNSFYRGTDGGTTFVEINSFGDLTKVYNNLGSAPNTTPAEVMIDDNGTNTTSSNNTFTDTPGWETEPPTTTNDFQIVPTSTAVDGGILVAGMALHDYGLTARDGNPDLGAWELIGNVITALANAGDSFSATQNPAALVLSEGASGADNFSAVVTPFVTAELQIFIEGVEQTGKYVPASISLEAQLQRRKTLTFDLVDVAQSYRPAVGHDVEVFYNANKIFAGTVDDFDESDPDAAVNFIRVGCVDYNQLADRFRVAKNYETENQTLRDIVLDLVSVAGIGGDGGLLAAEGVTTFNVQQGPPIAKAIFNYVTIADAFDDLANETAFVWWIDYDKDLHFVDPSTQTAPFGIGTGTPKNYRSLSVRSTRRKYRNRQIFRGGTQPTVQRTETFIGDGDNKTFDLAFPVDNVPEPEENRPTITLNGSPQTVGVRGRESEDSAQWFYQRGQNQISQNGDATALSATDRLSVTYVGQFPVIIDFRDEVEIDARATVEGGTGEYHDAESDDDVDTFDLGIERARGLLRRFGFIPEIVTVETDVFGLEPGHLVQVFDAAHNVDDEYLVTSVRTRDIGTGNEYFRHRVQLERDERYEDWVEFFKKLFAIGKKFEVRENESLVLVRRAPETIGLSDSIVTSTNPLSLLSGRNDPYTRIWYGTVGALGTPTAGFEDIPSFVYGFARYGKHPNS